MSSPTCNGICGRILVLKRGPRSSFCCSTPFTFLDGVCDLNLCLPGGHGTTNSDAEEGASPRSSVELSNSLGSLLAPDALCSVTFPWSSWSSRFPERTAFGVSVVPISTFLSKSSYFSQGEQSGASAATIPKTFGFPTLAAASAKTSEYTIYTAS